MFSCTYEIGNNLFTFLMALGATLAPIIATMNVYISRHVRAELSTNTGTTVKDTVQRTESTISAVADKLNVDHEPPPTGEVPVITPVLPPRKG